MSAVAAAVDSLPFFSLPVVQSSHSLIAPFRRAPSKQWNGHELLKAQSEEKKKTQIFLIRDSSIHSMGALQGYLGIVFTKSKKD